MRSKTFRLLLFLLPLVVLSGSVLFLWPTNTEESEAASAIRSKIVSWAKAQVEKQEGKAPKYQMGGNCTKPFSKIASKQCDCSSFTQRAYREAGISIPRTTWTQRDASKPVSKPKIGDLAFSSSFGHVAVYIGNGKVAHARGNAYGIVISSSAGRDFYRPVALTKALKEESKESNSGNGSSSDDADNSSNNNNDDTDSSSNNNNDDTGSDSSSDDNVIICDEDCTIAPLYGG